ncbi:MAG: hypothetical protein ABWX67_12730 [Allosphingosinicella sp.]
MRDEIEDLWSLADECREWSKLSREQDNLGEMAEFNRLAKKLDEIAKRLAEKEP